MRSWPLRMRTRTRPTLPPRRSPRATSTRQAAEPGRHRRATRFGVIWLGLAVSAFFLYLAVRNVRPSEVWDALTRSDYWWTIPAIALLFLAQVVRALRWQYRFAAATRPPH